MRTIKSNGNVGKLGYIIKNFGFQDKDDLNLAKYDQAQIKLLNENNFFLQNLNESRDSEKSLKSMIGGVTNKILQQVKSSSHDMSDFQREYIVSQDQTINKNCLGIEKLTTMVNEHIDTGLRDGKIKIGQTGYQTFKIDETDRTYHSLPRTNSESLFTYTRIAANIQKWASEKAKITQKRIELDDKRKADENSYQLKVKQQDKDTFRKKKENIQLELQRKKRDREKSREKFQENEINSRNQDKKVPYFQKMEQRFEDEYMFIEEERFAKSRAERSASKKIITQELLQNWEVKLKQQRLVNEKLTEIKRTENEKRWKENWDNLPVKNDLETALFKGNQPSIQYRLQTLEKEAFRQNQDKYSRRIREEEIGINKTPRHNQSASLMNKLEVCRTVPRLRLNNDEQKRVGNMYLEYMKQKGCSSQRCRINCVSQRCNGCLGEFTAEDDFQNLNTTADDKPEKKPIKKPVNYLPIVKQSYPGFGRSKSLRMQHALKDEKNATNIFGDLGRIDQFLNTVNTIEQDNLHEVRVNMLRGGNDKGEMMDQKIDVYLDSIKTKIKVFEGQTKHYHDEEDNLANNPRRNNTNNNTKSTHNDGARSSPSNYDVIIAKAKTGTACSVVNKDSIPETILDSFSNISQIDSL